MLKKLLSKHTKVQIQKARNKNLKHASSQYASFLRKAEQIDEVLQNLGYKITIFEKKLIIEKGEIGPAEK